MHAGLCEDAGGGCSLLRVVELAAAAELAVPRLDEEVAVRGARPAGEGHGLWDGALPLGMQGCHALLGRQDPVGVGTEGAGLCGVGMCGVF